MRWKTNNFFLLNKLKNSSSYWQTVKYSLWNIYFFVNKFKNSTGNIKEKNFNSLFILAFVQSPCLSTSKKCYLFFIKIIQFFRVRNRSNWLAPYRNDIERLSTINKGKIGVAKNASKTLLTLLRVVQIQFKVHLTYYCSVKFKDAPNFKAAV